MDDSNPILNCSQALPRCLKIADYCVLRLWRNLNPHVLGLSEAGDDNVKLYVGSWSDWISFEYVAIWGLCPGRCIFYGRSQQRVNARSMKILLCRWHLNRFLQNGCKKAVRFCRQQLIHSIKIKSGDSSGKGIYSYND